MANVDVSAQRYKKMMETPIPKLVASMALPATVSTMISVIYNTADTYFVSKINPSASAAVGVVYSIMAILQAVGFGMGMGCGSLISRHLGKKMDKEASVFASSGLAGAMLAGLLVGVVGLSVLRPLLRLIGASETMMPYAEPYARVILMAAPISCSGFVLTNVTRAEGNTKLSMWASMLGGLLNMVLDPLLIFGLDLGAGGAAIATAMSQCFSWIILFWNFGTGRTILKLRVSNVSRQWSVYKQIIFTGSPTVFRQGLGSLSATALNVSAVAYGDATVAAITIANKVYTLVRQMTLGIGHGFQPVAGYNFGAGHRKRAFAAFKFATLLGTVICSVAAVFTFAFAKEIMWWFSDSPEVARIGIQTLRIASVTMPLLGFSAFINQLYQCLGFSRIASLLASCRQGIFFMPIILVLPRFIDALGVQATQPLADLMTFLISIPFAVRFYRREVKPFEKECGAA